MPCIKDGVECVFLRACIFQIERPQAPLSHSLLELNFIKGLLTPKVFELHCQEPNGFHERTGNELAIIWLFVCVLKIILKNAVIAKCCGVIRFFKK
jgi:hypothetical protein